MSAPFHRLPPFWDEQAEQMPVSATFTASRRPFLVLNFRASCTRSPITSARIPGKTGPGKQEARSLDHWVANDRPPLSKATFFA